MSFFDASERPALTLKLSENDPFDADYLTPDGTLLYRVRTRKCKRSAGFGRPDAETTIIQRVRANQDPAFSSDKTTCVDHSDRPNRSSCSDGSACRRCSPRCASRRRMRSSNVSLSTPLGTIDEVAGPGTVTGAGEDSENTDTDSATTPPHEPDSDRMILVASIERRPFSLSPVTLRFNGTEVLATKFLRRERPFSSTRCFVSLTGDLLKWQLSSPSPKLYNSNKTRIAKYYQPFLPSQGVLSSKTATVQIAEGIESDRALDEIIVTLLLTFLL